MAEPLFKVTQYKDGNPSTERKVEGVAETLEAFSALVHQHATTDTRAATLIADAAESLPKLPLGAGITAIPDSTHCITIHRLVQRR